MASVGAKLYEGQPGTSDTLLYTDPAVTGNGTAVRGIEIANSTGTAATITLGFNAGGALGAENYFCCNMAVPANGVNCWEGFQMISSGGTIRGLQGTGGALTVTISGVQM